MAVDYVKTGQPAHLASDLRPLKWPHFMEKVGRKQHQIYTSKKVLGQLYDQVERIDFVPAFTSPFDTRILQAYTLDENILRSAREVKVEYDAHMRRIMAQQEIKTEFEVWSTFVLQHSNTRNDFKYHEQIGEISVALKDQFRLICHERAGGKDYEHIGPFAAAMYEVTAREMAGAIVECHRIQMYGGRPRPLREMTPSAMPLMSFPWLFHDILGKIAKSSTLEDLGTSPIREEIAPAGEIKAPQPRRSRAGPSVLSSGDCLETSKGTTRPGELLELFGSRNESCQFQGPAEAEYTPSGSSSIKSSESSTSTRVERHSSANDLLIDPSSSSSPELLARKFFKNYPHDAKVRTEIESKSTSDFVSHLRGSRSPLHSQGRTEVAGLARKKQDTALNGTLCEQGRDFEGASRVGPDHIMPEGSNLRLSNNLRSEDTEELDQSFPSGRKLTAKDVSLAEDKIGEIQELLTADGSDEVEKNGEKEAILEEKSTNHEAYDDIGYSSDSNADSDEAPVSMDVKSSLFDQLAKMAEDSSASYENAIIGSPISIQDSTDRQLDRTESSLVPVSLIPRTDL